MTRIQPRTFAVILAASAGASVLGMGGRASAYALKTTSSGADVRWTLGTHPVLVDATDSSGAETHDALQAAVTAAAAAWSNALPGSPIQLQVAGSCDATAQTVDPNRTRAAVVWAHGSWGYTPGVLALTFTSYDASSGEVAGTLTVINDAEFAFGDMTDEDGAHGNGHGEPVYDLQSLVTHELGHALGLAHSQDDGSVMWATQDAGSTAKRTLTADDLAGLSQLYVVNALLPPAGCSVAGGWRSRRSAGDALLCGLALLMLASAAGLRRRLRRAGAVRTASATLVAVVVGVAGLALAAPRASASGAVKLSPAELASHADLVVLGRAVAARAAEVGGVIVTETTVAIPAGGCLKGSCPHEIVVETYGGELPDGRGMQVDGAGRIEVGSDVLLFAQAAQDGGALRPVGLAQGIFRIEQTAAGLVAARDLSGLALVSGGAAVEGAAETLPLAPLLETVRAALARHSM